MSNLFYNALRVNPILSFMTSVLATEDNTTVTVEGYSPNVQFSNGTTGATQPTITFSLNKGQSYIIDGLGNIEANSGSFIGSKITSNKPISVTNGNFNGQYAGNHGLSSDILMDQSIPTNQLGSTFALVKGNGNIGTNMEGALIVAVEDNTQIFLNGEPTAAATINEGEYYVVPDTKYQQQGNNHYNLYITSTHNIYVYQLLAGTDNSTNTIATGGFNFIPSLNCYLPRKIDEIGLINENQVFSNGNPGGVLNIPTKLNLITEAGSSVTINGAAPPAGSGPYTLTGNNNWVTYSIPNVSGNVTVESDKAITAGINAGSDAVGYGGYFAGFSSTPFIEKISGECIPGLVIGVDPIYETYQWFLNGNPISGANSNTFTPTLPGVYTLTLSILGCPAVTTEAYNVYPCPKITTENINICGGKTFQVAFSQSAQTLDVNSIIITTPPTNGTAVINTQNGTITYTSNPGYLGPDSFTYKFQSTVPTFFDSEIVTVNMNVVLLETQDANLTACPYNGTAIYDLTATNLTTFANAVIHYYPTLSDAQNGTNQIPNPSAYVSAEGNVYAKVTTPEGCTDYSKITLKHYTQPEVKDATLISCFLENETEKAEFNLLSANVGGETNAVKKYYPSLVDAENNTNEITNPYAYKSFNTNVYVRVYNTNGCYSIAKINLHVTPPKFSQTLQDKAICIEDRTTLDAGSGFTSYLWSTGATTQIINNVSVGEYWVILTSDGCPTKQTVHVNKVPEVVISNVDISNNTITINAVGGTAPYQYSADAINWQDSNIFTGVPRGQNTFFVKDSFDCEPVSIEITVVNLVNAITPNDDGINDFVDYSALRYKENISFGIYDRYGNKLYIGDEKNSWRWDGRSANKKVLTGTYWYQISWNENNTTKTPVKYSGWIVVKNR